MGRPVTMFTGQWADLSLEAMCTMMKGFGFDGLDHLDRELGGGLRVLGLGGLELAEQFLDRFVVAYRGLDDELAFG